MDTIIFVIGMVIFLACAIYLFYKVDKSINDNFNAEMADINARRDDLKRKGEILKAINDEADQWRIEGIDSMSWDVEQHNEYMQRGQAIKAKYDSLKF